MLLAELYTFRLLSPLSIKKILKDKLSCGVRLCLNCDSQDTHDLGSLIFLDRQQDPLQSFLRHETCYFVTLKYFESNFDKVTSIFGLQPSIFFEKGGLS